MLNQTRVEALAAAKVAIRAYSRDPSDRNAARVEAAWQTIRTLDAVSAWRQRHPATLEPRDPSNVTYATG